MWVTLEIIGIFLWSLCIIIDKYLIDKKLIKSPISYSMINGLMSLLFIPFFFFYDIPLYSFIEMTIMLFAGAAYIGFVMLYYTAIKYEDASTLAFISAFAPIFTLTFAFFILGERLSLNHLIAFVLLFIAGLLPSLHRTKKHLFVSVAFYLMLGALFIQSLGNIAEKYAFTHFDFIAVFVYVRMGSLLAVSLVLAQKKYRSAFIDNIISGGKRLAKIVSFKIILDIAALFLVSVAFLYGPVSLISVIAKAFIPLFVFLLALFISWKFPHIIKERFNTNILITKAISLILIFGGLYLLQ